MSGKMMTAAALAVAIGHVVITGRAVELDARQPADVAGKLSGTWVLNRELSIGFAAPARGRGRGGPPSAFAEATADKSPGLRRPGAAYSRAPFAATATAQRGGGFGDQSDLTPEQRAEQAAMRQLQQIESRITIKASAAEVTFIDSRGEQTFAINDKTATVLLASSPVKVKLKWDKQALKQEFSNSQAKLVQTWSLDNADHLVMTAKVESLTLVTPERKAVFDRQ